MNYASLIISALALTVSVITFWLTRLKVGQIKMTRPTVIFFGPDGSGEKHKKIFIRTLLYSTSDKGQYVQNIYIKLKKGESSQNFNVWVYGDNNKSLVRGSGLFVNKNGVVFNHHFLMPKDATNYEFISGEYQLCVFVETINKKPIQLFEQELTITKEQEKDILGQNAGIYFDWTPNTQSYISHVDIKPKQDLPYVC